eukprot:GHRQ01021832.1.p1 GENE.GHRQ01021832.1~~GHRQ01021832.1.p1  ORF type:complete len:149 (+),score=47.74 GHRQ01021832.1:87-533(+)
MSRACCNVHGVQLLLAVTCFLLSLLLTIQPLQSLTNILMCRPLVQVHVYTINPLALSNDELYGSFEEATHEWRDGVLARLMRTACKDESPDQKWILFDGPVVTLWIESMNTTLDDNKLLTLLSGGRHCANAECHAVCCNRVWPSSAEF